MINIYYKLQRAQNYIVTYYADGTYRSDVQPGLHKLLFYTKSKGVYTLLFQSVVHEESFTPQKAKNVFNLLRPGQIQSDFRMIKREDSHDRFRNL
jgi:hypothetical protein